MKISQRVYHESDQEVVLQLCLETRTGKSLERYPTFWRLWQELATRLWEPEQDAHIWENTHGQAALELIRKPLLWQRSIEHR